MTSPGESRRSSSPCRSKLDQPDGLRRKAIDLDTAATTVIPKPPRRRWALRHLERRVPCRSGGPRGPPRAARLPSLRFSPRRMPAASVRSSFGGRLAACARADPAANQTHFPVAGTVGLLLRPGKRTAPGGRGRRALPRHSEVQAVPPASRRGSCLRAWSARSSATARAGIPTTVAPAGTSLSTTASGAIRKLALPRPARAPGAVPIRDPAPIVGPIISPAMMSTVTHGSRMRTGLDLHQAVDDDLSVWDQDSGVEDDVLADRDLAVIIATRWAIDGAPGSRGPTGP